MKSKEIWNTRDNEEIKYWLLAMLEVALERPKNKKFIEELRKNNEPKSKTSNGVSKRK